jgi:hypothetical protein
VEEMKLEIRIGTNRKTWNSFDIFILLTLRALGTCSEYVRHQQFPPWSTKTAS